MEHRAVIAGGTGLVGRALVATLESAPQWSRVTALVRRNGVDLGKRTETVVVDFADMGPEVIPEGSTAAFCALGTTMKKAGSKAAFRAVDHDAVLAFAKACRERGVPQFHLVSALGADADSRVFYNRVKGETERALRALGFASLVLHRPALLLGERHEHRAGENRAILFERLVRPALIGPLRRYRGIPAATVARAMVRTAEAPRGGTRVLESDELARRGA